MKSVGIICEYNPFHNGHEYHINKIKEMYPDYTIILVLSPSFTERGEVSIINKFDKVRISLEAGIDLIVELPFPFATQSADFFAKGALQILNYLNCEYLVFGSESNDIEVLKLLANTQINNPNYNNLVKKYLSDGNNYPTAMNKALKEITKLDVNDPNDILGLSYVKEIISNNYSITPITIKRTNHYHALSTKGKIISASAIRNMINEHKNIKKYIPKYAYKYIKKENFNNKLFELLKYKILTEKDLGIYQTVDEGIENRILKYIDKSNSLEELIMNIKTKRYTYNKISRMFIHILCSFTKEEANKFTDIGYIRILGCNDCGKRYLNKIKKSIDIPIITNPRNNTNEMFLLENRITSVYNLITNNNIKDNLETPII